LPAPHIGAVESVIDYRVPVDKFSPLSGVLLNAADAQRAR